MYSMQTGIMYVQSGTKVENFKPKQGASNLWQRIIKAKEIHSNNVMIAVGNGKNTSFLD